MGLSASLSLITSDMPHDKLVYDENSEAEIQQYMRQTRLWRVANSAQWIAWGIVQAKVAALEKEEEEGEKEKKASAQVAANLNSDITPITISSSSSSSSTTTMQAPNEERPVQQDMQIPPEEPEESEFDYLAYAQDRALFFWADVLAMGLIRENELPAGLLEAVKPRMLNY